MPRRQPRPWWSAASSSAAAEPAALQARPDGVRRQDPHQLADQRRGEPDDLAVGLGHPAAARVGGEQVQGAGRHSSARCGGRGARVGPAALVGAQVELVEAPGELTCSQAATSSGRIGRIRASALVGGHRPPTLRSSRGWAHASPGRPRQVRRHPHRGRGGRGDRRRAGAGRRPATSSTCCRCPTAARASSTCCTPRSAASCSAGRRCAARSATRCRPTVLRVGDTAYVESAQACGLHLTGEAGTPSARDVRRRRAGRSPPASPAPAPVVVGLGGSGTNDGGAGLLAALGATADRPARRGRRRAWPASPASTSPGAPASRASSWSPPATSTTR